MDSFEHDGLRFDLDDLGPPGGEPVILLHGFPQDRSSWSVVAPRLVERGYRVLAPDQRGYSPGARPSGRQAYRADRLCEDVLALADAAGVDRFHLVGHDWGGIVGWWLAMDRPDRLLTLSVLSTPHPRAFAEALPRSTQALASWYVGLLQLPALPEMLTGGLGRPLFRRALERSGLRPERARRYVELLADGAAGPAIGWYRALPLGGPRRMEAVVVPTLYVYGAGDPSLRRVAADRTALHVSGPYRYEVIEGGGHWLPEEHGPEVAALLVDHLGAHRSPSPR